MQTLIHSQRYQLAKSLVVALLVLAHIALVTGASEVYAMESANYKVNESVVSSGGGKNVGTGTEIPYSNIAESSVDNVESSNYKASLGYINTIASNPPVFRTLIPDANMRLMWNKGEPCPVTVLLDTYFYSPDNSPLRYEVEGGSNISVSIDPASHVASFSQANPDYFGSENIRFVAIDENENRTNSNYITLIVKATDKDNPPVIYPINDITVNENELIQVAPVVFDPDGDLLTVTFTAPLNDSGKWQTTYSDDGIYKVTAAVSDETLKASASFNITVKNVNRPPIVDPIPDISVSEGEIVKLNVRVSDPDGDNTTVSYPAPFETDGGWQTTFKDAGAYHFTITASDGELSAAGDVNITVNNVNAPPAIQLYANKANVSPGEEFTIYLLAQDPDGDDLKLTLKKDGTAISGCENIILGGQTFSKTLSISNSGSHTVEAVVEETGVAGAPNTAAASLKISVEENSAEDGYFPISGDFNGDGLTDLGYYNRPHAIWKVALSRGDGSFGAYEYWINSSDDFGPDNKWFYPMTADFNGDGKTDVGFTKVPAFDGFTTTASYVRIAISNGKGFDVKSGNWRISSDGSLQSDWHNALFSGDFNGDGFSDIGQIRVDSNQSLYVGLTLNNLAIDSPTSWINGGRNVSVSNFSPIAADFNGDGLTDVCLFEKSEGRWAVTLSKGNAFGDTADWMTSFGADKDPILGDFNCDGLTDIGYIEKEDNEWSVKYAISDGTKFNLDSGNPYIYQTTIPDSITGTFITGDFNGDGLFDVAFFDKSTREWTVKLHHSKFPDLLVEIDNGIGGKTAITYKDSVMYENKDADGLPTLPFSIRVVSQVAQTDGIGSVYATRYFYRNGVFEPAMREFRGFGYVKVIDVDGNYKETYFNQDDMYKGRPKSEVVRDGYNRIYAETLYNWQNTVIASPPQGAGEAISFPYLADKTSKAYDPVTGESKSSKTIYAYDYYGNASNVREEGFLDVSGDEKEAHVDYYYDTDKWILSKPIESRIKDASGATVAATKYEYYTNGSLKKEERWLGQVGNSPAWGIIPDNPTTEFTYDTTGNVETVKDARGNVTAAVYDATKTFPESVYNAIGHAQSFTYNKATGKILTSIDPNNQTTTSEYDGFGRQTHVTGPGNISEVTYTYDLAARPAKITTETVIASHAEGGAKQSIKAFSFVDGLGRQILSRIEAEYKGAAKHIVSGVVKYDSRGQIVKKYLPFYADPYDPLSDPSNPLYTPIDPLLDPSNPLSATLYSTPFVRYEYDAMGRLVKTIRPDNKASYTIYGINKIEAINENGQHARQTKDAYGRIIEVEEDTGDLTNYTYDTLGNLTDTLDSASLRNHVRMQYDTLGRKVAMTDPDMGGAFGKNWQYYYDKVGNLTSQVDAKGQILEFEYDAINQLISKKHRGGDPAGDGDSAAVELVHYTYDDAAKPNCVGRLSRVTDSSGQTEFFYDILGREIKTTKTITTASYTIERTFDSLDRLTTVKYPDNYVVTYAYNKQGGIASLRGGTGGADEAIYVSSVDYNANGQIERITYGNGTSTDYKYDPYNLRLQQLRTIDSGLSTIQQLSYNFDPIGNVTSILDDVYTNTQHFQYDNLNRLTLATGASYGQIDYAYNSIGNLLKKGNITMEYGQAAGPHAVTTLNRGGYPAGGGGSAAVDVVSISYDANGNMTSKGAATFDYDIENRLKRVATPKGGGTFDLSLNFTPGWNFFSLPGFIPNTSGTIKDVLSSIEGKYDEVLTYDTTEGKWKHYVGNTKFNQFDKFEYGKGYLIYVKESCTLNLTGSFPLTAQTSPLKSGWNLICAPTDSEIDTEKALKGISYDAIAEYDSSLRATEGSEAIYTYNPSILQKGHAYWVHVNADQVWSVPLPESETSYAYDGDGGRIMRLSSSGGIFEHLTTNRTIYIGSSYEVEKKFVSSKTTKHIFMGSTRVCSIETTHRAIPIEPPQVTAHIYYYHQDHIGSSNVITDETGAVVNILEYSPFGEVSRDSGDYSTDKRFTGKIYDESSALSYFGARYYDPELGRFITADPTIAHPFDPQDLNRYSYCRNNPINYVDPTGYSWWSAFWNWVAGVCGAIVGVVVTALTGGNFILGAAVGGAVYGGIMGAVNGGFEGALKGAAMGFLMGAGMAIGAAAFGPAFVYGALAYGAVNSYATGGWEGVGDYAAGLAGGAVGFYAGSAMVSGTTNIGLNGQPRSATSKNIASSETALRIDNKPVVDPSEPGAGYTKNVGVEGQPTWDHPGNQPSNRGFLGNPQSMTLQPGAIIDRYGPPTGEFLSPQGVPPGARSLPSGVANLPLKTYEVLKPFKVYGGPAAPAHNQSGLGMQYDLGKGNSVQSLIKGGYIREI